MMPADDSSMSLAAKVRWKFSDNVIQIITNQTEGYQRRQEHEPGYSYPL